VSSLRPFPGTGSSGAGRTCERTTRTDAQIGDPPASFAPLIRWSRLGQEGASEMPICRTTQIVYAPRLAEAGLLHRSSWLRPRRSEATVPPVLTCWVFRGDREAKARGAHHGRRAALPSRPSAGQPGQSRDRARHQSEDRFRRPSRCALARRYVVAEPSRRRANGPQRGLVGLQVLTCSRAVKVAMACLGQP
jgi:hypothetical protein